MPNPSQLLVPAGKINRYKCRDCGYEAPYATYKHAKRDIARHWSDHHHPPEPKPEPDLFEELAEAARALSEVLHTGTLKQQLTALFALDEVLKKIDADLP